MASDGRVTQEDDIPIREDCKKLYRYSKNVCVGFAGTLQCCEILVENLRKNENSDFSLEKIFLLCCKYAIDIVNLPKFKGYGKILLVVGGRSVERNCIRIRSFSTLEKEEMTYCVPTEDNICYVSASPNIDDCNDILRKHLELCNPNDNFSLRYAIKDTIEEASTISKKINNNVFFERIK